MPLREQRKVRSKGSVGLKKEKEEGCHLQTKPTSLKSEQRKTNSSKNVVVQYDLKTKKFRIETASFHAVSGFDLRQTSFSQSK